MKQSLQTTMFAACFFMQMPLLNDYRKRWNESNQSKQVGNKNERSDDISKLKTQINITFKKENKKQGSHTKSLAFL